MTVEQSDYNPVSEVVNRLRDHGHTVTRRSGGYNAQCPAHPDRNPSLSVSAGQDGRALIHCHAGCSPRDILDALDLDPGQLFTDYDPTRETTGNLIHIRAWKQRQPKPPKPPSDTRREKTHHWDYTTPHGQPVARVVRYDLIDKATGEIVGKTFTQHAISPDGSVQPNLGGIDMPLYNAPAVANAITSGTPIVICEGEKDADTATSLGLPATTCAQGAGSWRPHHTAQLAGAAGVIIVADNDPPGIAHAFAIHQQLSDAGIYANVYIPKGDAKDLTEHVAQGGGIGDLLPYDEAAEAARIAEETRERFPAIDWEALWADESEEEWIVEPLLPARRMVALYSAPKVGKSLLMLEIAVGIATGSVVLGYTVKRPYRVLYVDFENDPKADTRDRLKNMGYGPADLRNLIMLSFPTMAALDSQAGAEELLAAVAAYDTEVVVIDTVSRAIKGEENENDTWLAFYRHTGLRIKQAGVSLVRLDHSGKDETKGQRGGSAKSGDVDAIWRMSKITEETFKLECEAARLPITEKTLVLHRKTEPKLHHQVDAAGAAATFGIKVEALIEWLDANGIPDDASTHAIRKAKTEMDGPRASNEVIGEAAKRRKERLPAWG